MGFLDRFKSKGASRVETMSFQVGPELRTVDSGGVEALDAALARVGTGEVMHAMDPRRINAFSSGGPSTWSVAMVPVGHDVLCVTYGNSDRIDPARTGVGFELSIRVPARTDGLWTVMLLRQLVRYMLMSGRELKGGDFLPLPSSITTAVGDVGGPATRMDSVVLTEDPLLPTVMTPRGPLAVRRVVGILPDERDLMHLWSATGLIDQLAMRSAALTTDVTRASLASDPSFVAAMTAGSAREGSQFAFVAVPGVSWTDEDDGSVSITFPGGGHGRRIRQMIEARLPHGKHLLIHDSDPDQRLGVVLRPTAVPEVNIDGEIVEVCLPPDSPMLRMFATADDAPVGWRFR